MINGFQSGMRYMAYIKGCEAPVLVMVTGSYYGGICIQHPIRGYSTERLTIESHKGYQRVMNRDDIKCNSKDIVMTRGDFQIMVNMTSEERAKLSIDRMGAVIKLRNIRKNMAAEWIERITLDEIELYYSDKFFPLSKKRDRNKEIAICRLIHKMKYTEISEKYSLSVERSRQIVIKFELFFCREKFKELSS